MQRVDWEHRVQTLLVPIFHTKLIARKNKSGVTKVNGSGLTLEIGVANQSVLMPQIVFIPSMYTMGKLSVMEMFLHMKYILLPMK